MNRCVGHTWMEERILSTTVFWRRVESNRLQFRSYDNDACLHAQQTSSASMLIQWQDWWWHICEYLCYVKLVYSIEGHWFQTEMKFCGFDFRLWNWLSYDFLQKGVVITWLCTMDIITRHRRFDSWVVPLIYRRSTRRRNICSSDSIPIPV